MRVGAAGLLMIFMTGWLATPLTLAFPDDPSCSMECCLTMGYCSCRMGSTGFSIDDDHDHADAAWSIDEDAPRPGEMAAVSIGSPCPEKCAQVPSGIRNIAAHGAAAPEHSTAFSLKRLLELRTPWFAREALLAEASGPRAPPAFLL